MEIAGFLLLSVLACIMCMGLVTVSAHPTLVVNEPQEEAASHISFERLRECVEGLAPSEPKAKKKKGGRPLVIYQDGAAEVVSALSKKDVAQLAALAQCYAVEDPYAVVTSSSLPEEEDTSYELPALSEPVAFRVGSPEEIQALRGKRIAAAHPRGSSLTYLNGVLPKVLPDIYKKICEALVSALKYAKWPGYKGLTAVNVRRKLGLRSVKLHSAVGGDLVTFKEELDLRKEEGRIRGGAIAFGAGESSVEELRARLEMEKAEKLMREKEYDPYSDYVMYRTLHPLDEGDLYTVFILLNHRNDFVGGELVVNKRTVNEMKANFVHDGEMSLVEIVRDEVDGKKQTEYDPHYEEDDENTQKAKRKRTKWSELGRHLPEQAAVMVVRSDCEHGTTPVQAGHREILTLQFWQYADAPLGSREPSLSEAVPLKVHDEEL